jgi:hypothetical protein
MPRMWIYYRGEKEIRIKQNEDECWAQTVGRTKQKEDGGMEQKQEKKGRCRAETEIKLR